MSDNSINIRAGKWLVSLLSSGSFGGLAQGLHGLHLGRDHFRRGAAAQSRLIVKWSAATGPQKVQCSCSCCLNLPNLRHMCRRTLGKLFNQLKSKSSLYSQVPIVLSTHRCASPWWPTAPPATMPATWASTSRTSRARESARRHACSKRCASPSPAATPTSPSSPWSIWR